MTPSSRTLKGSRILESLRAPDLSVLDLKGRGWAVLILLAAVTIGLWFRWDILFYDSIYYLRTVGNPKLFHFTWTPGDRWVHTNFLLFLVRGLGGPSAFAFHFTHWLYRGLMFLAILVWWMVFKRLWSSPKFNSWGLFFLVTSPLMIYNPNQILPEQWSLLLTGWGIWLFLAGLDRRWWWIHPLAGALLYLGFLSRSDILLLPAAFLLSCFVSGFRSRKEQVAAWAGLLLGFVPLFMRHLHFVGWADLNPMARAMWEYKQGDIDWSLKEFWRAAGLHIPLGILAFTQWRDRGTRVLATTSLILYAFFIGWILLGRVAYGRQTLQGVVVLTALGTVGWGVAWGALKRWIPAVRPFWLAAICTLFLVPLHISFANRATGGVDLDRAKEVFETVKNHYRGSLLLVGDDPTYYFYQFYYPRTDRSHVFHCYAEGDRAQRRMYQVELEKQLGDEYLSSLKELRNLKPSTIIYLGDPGWSWLSVEEGVRFEPFSELGSYKGRPIMRVVLTDP